MSAHGGRIANTKSQVPNPKQIQIFQLQMTKTAVWEIGSLEHLNLFGIWSLGFGVYPTSMPAGFSQRLLVLLQLPRMALVFTAIADSLAANLLWASWMAAHHAP